MPATSSRDSRVCSQFQGQSSPFQGQEGQGETAVDRETRTFHKASPCALIKGAGLHTAAYSATELKCCQTDDRQPR